MVLPPSLRPWGYTQVGQDFPVFLHPETKEEYALARTERRTGPGHKGFAVDAGEKVTLQQDLERRDLTINAIAQTVDGRLIDPYEGRADLESRVLRAVSNAFAEDPLRIMRVARFACQLPGFAVHQDTTAMMQDMVRDGLLDELPGERVWQEFHKAIDTPDCQRFFEVLASVAGWQPFFAEFEPVVVSIDTSGWSAIERFALICETLSSAQVRAFCKRVRVPNTFRDWALLTLDVAEPLSRWRELDPEQRVDCVQRANGFHSQDHLDDLAVYLQHRYQCDVQALVGAVHKAAREIRADAFSGLQGRALGEALKAARAELLTEAAQRT